MTLAADRENKNEEKIGDSCGNGNHPLFFSQNDVERDETTFFDLQVFFFLNQHHITSHRMFELLRGS